MSFLPDGYSVPQTGNYLKLEEGATKFLILGSAILGYVYWNTADKPVRLKEAPKSPLPDIRTEQDGSLSKIKHFWAFPVYDFKSKSVMVLEITQKTIMGALQSLAKNDEWGDPILSYPITITRTGSGFETEYNVVPSPKTELPADIGDAWMKVQNNGFDLNRLFDGGDPFSGAAVEADDVTIDPTEADVPDHG